MRAVSDPYFSEYEQNRIRNKDNQYKYNRRKEFMDQRKRVFGHILHSKNLDVKHTFVTFCLTIKMKRAVK